MTMRSVNSLVASVRRSPGTVLVWLLGMHLVLWTAIPAIVSPNLQLDLVEDLALGKEWQLGYWKHPPLPWWLADALYRLTGTIDSVYVLGPLAAVSCLYVVWRLGREVTDATTALAAVLALEGLHFFNYSAVKFSHDQMQLPFWALTGWLLYRAIVAKRPLDWIAAGACLALAFWSKYAAFALAATIGLILVFDRDARACWRTPGPYLMAAAFLIVLAPNLWWLAGHDFLPLRYVDARAAAATHWFQYLIFPLRWTVSQIFFLLPTMVLLAILFAGRRVERRTEVAPFARRYVTALALGPFLITTVIAALLGRLPVSLWGYPLWSLAPLAVLLWYRPRYDDIALRRFVVTAAAIVVVLPVIYGLVELFAPLLRDRPKAAYFPGRDMARIVTQQWRDKTGTALRYVGGIAAGHGPGEFAANNVAVYSPDRPHVIVHGDRRLCPWIDPADLRRHGAVLIWQQAPGAAVLPPDIRRNYPGAELQPQLVLPSKNPFSRLSVSVTYAFVPPQP